MNLKSYVFSRVLLITWSSLGEVLGIIGGRPAEFYPFYALVMNGDQKCGGTVLTADLILTAAHCFYHQEKRRWVSPMEIYVLHGDFSTPDSWNLKYHSCEKYHVHNKYDPVLHKGRGPYDLAMIKVELEIGLSFAFHRTRLKLCFPRDLEYKNGIAIGLGLTNQNPKRHAVQLMEAEIQVNVSCGKHDSSSGFIHPGVQICYTAPNGDSNMCLGDSGGPIVYKQEGKVICLIGISTFVADQCNETDYPSVFISVGPYNNWIVRQIKRFFS